MRKFELKYVFSLSVLLMYRIFAIRIHSFDAISPPEHVEIVDRQPSTEEDVMPYLGRDVGALRTVWEDSNVRRKDDVDGLLALPIEIKLVIIQIIHKLKIN